MRTGNDRSVKTIKFLEQYAKLCTKYDRLIDAKVGTQDGEVQQFVLIEPINAEDLAEIKTMEEAS